MTRPVHSGRSAGIKVGTEAPAICKPGLNRGSAPIDPLNPDGVQHLHRAVLPAARANLRC